MISWTETDPLVFAKTFWPSIYFYSKQREIIKSVQFNDITEVVAGNKLGKDFVAGFVCLWYFMSPLETRIITTSVKDTHLNVLWGEIERWINTATCNGKQLALRTEDGGPLYCTSKQIRKIVGGVMCPISYMLGLVSAKPEGLAGHHAARTLGVIDEASSSDDIVYSQMETWGSKQLRIGNPMMPRGRFYTDFKAGDLEDPKKPGRYVRKVFQMGADASPNVEYGLLQKAAGIEPTNDVLVKGVITYKEYETRLLTWDKIRINIGIHGKFWEGQELLLFPPEWLDEAALFEATRPKPTVRKFLGVDVAEGGDETAWVVIDRYGILELRAQKTPDTTVIPIVIEELIKRWGIDPKDVVLDAGGGKPHADTLKAKGYPVRTISFSARCGYPAEEDVRPVWTDDRRDLDDAEQKWRYKNRRSQMYGELSALIDPARMASRKDVTNEFYEGRLTDSAAFCIPAKYLELRRQLAPVPKLLDGEGRQYLPPKNKNKPGSTEKCLTDIIGCSPDHSDALVLAVNAMIGAEVGTQPSVILSTVDEPKKAKPEDSPNWWYDAGDVLKKKRAEDVFFPV